MQYNFLCRERKKQTVSPPNREGMSTSAVVATAAA